MQNVEALKKAELVRQHGVVFNPKTCQPVFTGGCNAAKRYIRASGVSSYTIK